MSGDVSGGGSAEDNERLTDALATASGRGAIGVRAMHGALRHSEQFVAAIGADDATLVDLGSGGGLPGLVIAVRCPLLTVRLVERSRARADLLERSIRRLGLGQRVSVHHLDAAPLSHSARWVGWADVVTARSFATPVITLETAAPLVRAGGRILVAAPPPGDVRWSTIKTDLVQRLADRPGLVVFRRL